VPNKPEKALSSDKLIESPISKPSESPVNKSNRPLQQSDSENEDSPRTRAIALKLRQAHQHVLQHAPSSGSLLPGGSAPGRTSSRQGSSHVTPRVGTSPGSALTPSSSTPNNAHRYVRDDISSDSVRF
jgi:hypothetical protein